MHQHRPRRPGRRTLATVAVVVSALGPAVASGAAVAATTAHVPPTSVGVATPALDPASDFTAAVRSIDHGRGIVTLAGNGVADGTVSVAGDGVERTQTEIGPEGTWVVSVRVGRGERVVRVTSDRSAEVIDLPVVLRDLTAPGMLTTVDGIARTISIDGTGYPGAHFVIVDNGTTVGDADADADGHWSFVLRDRSFGEHHVEAFQYFDGTQNGGADDVYVVSGDALVSATTASRETGRATLAGRAPVGTTLRFSDDDGAVLGPDGRPLTAAPGTDGSWRAEVPFPVEARFHRVTVTTYDGADVVGTTEARVTVPIALTGSVRELPDGSVELSGAGEVGGVVALEDEDGKPLTAEDGQPIAAMTGRGWELVLPRSVLPDDVVVARQWVDGERQGAVRLVLPERPERPQPPAPGRGDEPAPAASAGVRPAAQDAATGRIAAGSTERLAFTGEDPTVPLVVAVALLGSGLAALGAVRFRRRRGARRS